MDSATAENTLEGLLAAVETRRAEGLSVAAACRAAGISTSTYYRRRRRTDAAPLAIPPDMPPVTDVAPEWPFAATPRAPLFWDQAFADEMTDSFIRREVGAGDGPLRPSRPVAAMAIPEDPRLARFVLQARRIGRRLSAGPMGVILAPLAAIALIAMLVVTAGWMVSVAADPAAWLSHPASAQVAVIDTAQPAP